MFGISGQNHLFARLDECDGNVSFRFARLGSFVDENTIGFILISKSTNQCQRADNYSMRIQNLLVNFGEAVVVFVHVAVTLELCSDGCPEKKSNEQVATNDRNAHLSLVEECMRISSSFLHFSSSLMANMSHAELDGAQTSIFFLVRFFIWRIASTMVTVLPVPGGPNTM